MTRDEFLKQSNELFFEIKEEFCQKSLEAAKPLFDKATHNTGDSKLNSELNTELTQVMTALSFEASCCYAEKLALLLFDHFSK